MMRTPQVPLDLWSIPAFVPQGDSHTHAELEGVNALGSANLMADGPEHLSNGERDTLVGSDRDTASSPTEAPNTPVSRTSEWSDWSNLFEVGDNVDGADDDGTEDPHAVVSWPSPTQLRIVELLETLSPWTRLNLGADRDTLILEHQLCDVVWRAMTEATRPRTDAERPILEGDYDEILPYATALWQNAFWRAAVADSDPGRRGNNLDRNARAISALSGAICSAIFRRSDHVVQGCLERTYNEMLRRRDLVSVLASSQPLNGAQRGSGVGEPWQHAARPGEGQGGGS